VLVSGKQMQARALNNAFLHLHHLLLSCFPRFFCLPLQVKWPNCPPLPTGTARPDVTVTNGATTVCTINDVPTSTSPDAANPAAGTACPTNMPPGAMTVSQLEYFEQLTAK
jgi:hypothetical protein